MYNIPKMLHKEGMVSGQSEGKKLIKQGKVTVDGVLLKPDEFEVSRCPRVIRVGTTTLNLN